MQPHRGSLGRASAVTLATLVVPRSDDDMVLIHRLRRAVSRVGMTGRDAVPVDGLGLADAIALLRDDLLKARAAGAGAEIQLPVESMTVVLKVTATRSVDGKAGFKVPVVELEVSGGGSQAARLGTDGDGRVRRAGGSGGQPGQGGLRCRCHARVAGA